jgi:hypothetical protein
VRLQHSRSFALYRDSLQAATAALIMFVFRNEKQNLGLAQTTSATIGSAPSAIGMGDGWYNQSVEEHEGCGDHQ